MNRRRWWTAAGSLAVLGGITFGAAPARAYQGPALEEPEGAEVLTQGPIHEAFAEPVLYDPRGGPVIPQAPPAAIHEIPPDQRPEGADVQWIPGYWSWDDSTSHYIWIPGVWRDIPPGRQWVPGYYAQAQNGYQWVPGYWASAEGAQQLQYLPEPPPSQENGPTSAAPTPNATWSPGLWVWQDGQYLWRPGFWVQPQQNWMWTPASYSWTPNGYLYNQGFWDYPLANRGLPFAPVAFNQPIYNQPGFQYSPTTALLGSALLSSLFVRPNYGSYYFGDYYGANNFGSGIYPFYAFHNSRYGYDPIYAYNAARNINNPNWAQNLHQVYTYRRDHPEARPPRTFAAMRNLAARPAGNNAPAALAASNMVLARRLNAFNGGNNAGENALRLQRVEQNRRQELARQATQFNQFRDERLKREAQGLQGNRAALTEPRRAEMARSPIIAARREGPNRVAAPEAPRHPEVNREIRPPGRSAESLRHVPTPEFHPNQHLENRPPHANPREGEGRKPK